MSTDRELADLIVASAGYRLFASPTDKRKVEAAASSPPVRRPKPSNREAIVAWELYLRAPAPPPPPPPPPPSPLATVWQYDAAFTEGGLSNFAGEPRDRAFQIGFRAVYVQLMHTAYVDANLAEMALPQWNAWTKIGWGTYGQGADPEEDGRNAAALCKMIPALKGWKANGEAWAEGDYSWKTEAFLNGWKAGGAPVPLGWSVVSSDTANFARAYAYAVALSVPGADIDLQVYGADHPGYTVGAGLGMLAQVRPEPVPVARTTMSFSLNGDGDGPFGDYLTWKGPRRIWRPDRATVQTFDQLVRT